MNDSTDKLSTHQKALAINLDQGIYGTVAEIGAGQEVARWFFRVGAAAGSIAKTISAYDMQISDQIYGKSGRYVSRERVNSMLDKEYRLLGERLGEALESHTRFFAFADTVTARNYTGTNECHGWVGLRFQSVPGGEANEVILHVNMLDRTNLRQQEALGTLGINLIYAAFHTERFTPEFLPELLSELGSQRVEIDLVQASGPAMEHMNPLDLGLGLVRHNLAQAVLFEPTGQLAAPNEVLRKRQIIVERGLYRYSKQFTPALLETASSQLNTEETISRSVPLPLIELSINNLREDDTIADEEYLRRLHGLTTSGQFVLLSRLKQSYSLTDYLRRYSQEPLRFTMGISTLAMLFADEYYADLPGGLLEATGKLFANNVRIYVRPMPRADFDQHMAATGIGADFVQVTDGQEVSIDTLKFRMPIDLLFRFVTEAGWIDSLP
jgi:hypothetical protein